MQEKEIKKSQSAGGIVVNSQGKIILVKHVEGTWSFPKGHVNQNEDILKVALREIYEETGLTDLELVKKFNSYERESLDMPPEQKSILLFLFRTRQTEIKPIAPDVIEALWVEKEKVPDLLTHEKDKEFFNRIKHEI